MLGRRCVVSYLHPGANLLPGANLHPGANFHPLASRSYANRLCPYVYRFNTNLLQKYAVFRRNSQNMLQVTVTLYCLVRDPDLSMTGYMAEALHCKHINGNLRKE